MRRRTLLTTLALALAVASSAAAREPGIDVQQFKPVTDVSLVGITYSGAAYTYMEPHGVPSAGDWALDRYGAIFLQGTEGAMISGCSIERVDGNGVMVSGYNRNATMKHNEISYVGGNAFAAWGYTNETATDPGRPGVEITNHPMAGVDGNHHH